MKYFLPICFITSMFTASTAIAVEEVKPMTFSNKETPNPEKKTSYKIQTSAFSSSLCGIKLNDRVPSTQLAMNFAQNAAMQSFTYNYKDKLNQWAELEKCYTSLGWSSFESAMSNSGNNQSITSEKLFVKATLNGKTKILDSNLVTPTWKVLVPLKVRYENKLHYLEQTLKVKVVVSVEKQKLGIDQIIASPALKKHKNELSKDAAKTSPNNA